MKLMTQTIYGGPIKAVAAMAMLAIGGMMVTSGCQMPETERPAAAPSMAHNYIDFWIEPSRRTIFAGETVTLTVRDQDTAGRDVNIDWTTTGGELTTERNNRIARVRFDSPGVYTITGRMQADDLFFSDSIDITVERVR